MLTRIFEVFLISKGDDFRENIGKLTYLGLTCILQIGRMNVVDEFNELDLWKKIVSNTECI